MPPPHQFFLEVIRKPTHRFGIRWLDRHWCDQPFDKASQFILLLRRKFIESLERML